METKTTKRAKNKLVYGVGVNDYPHATYINRVPIPAYKCWISMLRRCYSANHYPTYAGCVVCDEWLRFSVFKKWYDQQGDVTGLSLDKDILSGELIGKVYSPETCVFVPTGLNVLFVDHAKGRGKYPQGVDYMKHVHKFRAQIRRYSKKVFLGTYPTQEDAEIAYLYAKVAYVRDVIWKTSTTSYAQMDKVRFVEVVNAMIRFTHKHFINRLAELGAPLPSLPEWSI